MLYIYFDLSRLKLNESSSYLSFFFYLWCYYTMTLVMMEALVLFLMCS